MPISARNKLPGKIEEVQLGDVMAHVVVRVGDNLIESAITRRSADELKLKKGDTVTTVVKATEVMIQKDYPASLPVYDLQRRHLPHPSRHSFLARYHNPVRPFFFVQRLPIFQVRENDLLIRKCRIDLRQRNHGTISICSFHQQT